MSKKRRRKKGAALAKLKWGQTKLTSYLAKEKRSYPQDWQAYNEAKCSEQLTFMKMLSDICATVEQPPYERGRPRLPLSDMIFASALRVYAGFSLRRFMASMQKAMVEGYIQTSCTYVSISNFMRKPELMPILDDLITVSSLPLTSVEMNFAVDSSGFSTSRFARYFDFKHGKDTKYRTWIKAHIICGVKTGIITAAQLSEENRNDVHFLPPLVEKTAKSFDVQEVLADKAYSSRANYQFVNSLGATPFIPFRKNATFNAHGSTAWRKMYHYFMLKQEDFMKHYHQRSNCETVFHMIKSKFKDNIRSKDKVAQLNEVLLKVLCHNICVVIQEMHELGIDANFVNVRSGT
jgi:transposase